MRRTLPILAALTAFAVPASAAHAEVAHVVQPGETLWTIASANNLTTNSLAVYNGLSTSSNIVLGSTVRVPTTAEATGKLTETGLWAGRDGTTPSAPATAAPSAPSAMGGYTVRPGDTLSGLAAGAGVGVGEMAAMNGLDPAGTLVAGTVIKLPAGAPTPARAAEPAPSPVVAKASPDPTSQTVDASTVQSIASANGVPGSLAAAIGWQESGFNNSMVSSANARGVMQVMPGTWDWVNRNLSQTRLNPASAQDNVKAGVLYLGHLLKQTGGDESTAIAGYYQGLGSVQSRGNYDDTNQYVANVQALRGRFGGP